MRSTAAAEVKDTSSAGLDRSIKGFFRDVVRISWHEPERLLTFAKTAAKQRDAAARRRRWLAKGVHVPPLMIVSVTRSCDPHRPGRFLQAQVGPAGDHMSEAELGSIFAQARDLGVSMIALAGGEPLTRPEVLDIAAGFPEIQFLLSTDGSLIGGAILDKLESLTNVIPVLSLEGLEGETDRRRGDGAYRRAVLAMERMQGRRIFFGTSLTVTRRNFALVTGRAFVRDLVERGCRLFFYTDYAPIAAGTEHLVPSPSQRQNESLSMAILRHEFPALFLASSAMEQRFGGCMVAGKAFVHVNAEGVLEPCPFSPFADADLREVPLREALRSLLEAPPEDEGAPLTSGTDEVLWLAPGSRAA